MYFFCRKTLSLHRILQLSKIEYLVKKINRKNTCKISNQKHQKKYSSFQKLGFECGSYLSLTFHSPISNLSFIPSPTFKINTAASAEKKEIKKKLQNLLILITIPVLVESVIINGHNLTIMKNEKK